MENLISFFEKLLTNYWSLLIRASQFLHNFFVNFLSYLSTFWYRCWPSIPAIILTFLIDKQRKPRFNIYPEKHSPINTYEEMGTWKFVRFIVSNSRMPFFLRWFLHREVAQSCSATISFFNSEGNFLFLMRGRWANTVELAHIPRETRISRVIQPDPISIFPGEKESLDCITQNEKEDSAYGWNNAAYLFNWITPDFRLPKDSYMVNVRVMAQNGVTCSENFTLEVDNDFNLTKIR